MREGGRNDGRELALRGGANQSDYGPVPHQWRILGIVTVLDGDEVTGALDHDRFPPPELQALLGDHDMAWHEVVPATRQILGRGVWVRLRWLCGQRGAHQLAVDVALDAPVLCRWHATGQPAEEPRFRRPRVR